MECPENDADMIIGRLWLGNCNSALDYAFLEKNNIKYIVNVTDNVSSPFKNIMYYRIPIKDKETCCLHLKKIIYEQLDGALDFINKGLASGYGVLVHCKRGHHRSANVVLIFLMKYLRVGYIPCFMYISNIRPTALRRETCLNYWILNYYRERIEKTIL